MKGKELGFLGAVVPFHRDLIDAARQAAKRAIRKGLAPPIPRCKSPAGGSVLGRMPSAAVADVTARGEGEDACSRVKGGHDEHSDCSPRSRRLRAAAEA
jgi:hypothetical protein